MSEQASNGQPHYSQPPVGQIPGGQPPYPYGQPNYGKPPGSQPPYPYGQPNYGQLYAPATQPQSNGKGVASLILGICSIVSSGFVITGVIAGIIGLVLASLSKKQIGKNGLATGGLITSIIGLVLSIITLLMFILLIVWVIPTLGDDPSLFGNYDIPPEFLD